MPVTYVVGAQYGSEGKGNIVAKIARQYDVHVRVGGPNAGHSLIHEGRVWKMRQVPCGWVNPDAILVLAAGAVVSPEVLLDEHRRLAEAGFEISDRLKVDANATILDPWHHELEDGTDGELHRAIGSTGEGVGAARIARLRRAVAMKPMRRPGEVEPLVKLGLVDDTVEVMRNLLDRGYSVLVEGSQGSALSITFGPWPYVTTGEPNAAGLAADCGFSPTLPSKVILVARTYPIRVAGHSGPLKGELTWEEMSRRMGKMLVERTTVTNKVRRIGEWDDELFLRAVVLNRPTEIALTFMDYVDPGCEGMTDARLLSNRAWRFIHRVEKLANAPVTMVGTGGPEWALIRLETGRAYAKAAAV